MIAKVNPGKCIKKYMKNIVAVVVIFFNRMRWSWLTAALLVWAATAHAQKDPHVVNGQVRTILVSKLVTA